MTSLNRMKKLLAWLLAVSACISMAACPVAAAETTPAEPSGITTLAAGGAAVDETTQWRYLDNNTDPAGDSAAEGYDRLSWAKAGYDDSSWKTAAGTFGAKNGAIANLGAGYTDVDFTPSVLLSQYINGVSGDDIPAFFFRTTFQVENASAVTKLLGELYYDDAAIVYINGVKVAAFDEPNGGYASNLSYGGSNAGAPKLGEISVSDTSMLVNGDNILAVELHQGRSSSSDIYLAVKELSLSTEPVSNELEVDSLTVNIGETEDCLGITWYDTDPGAAVLHWNGTDYTAAVKQASKTGYYVNHVDLSGLKPSTQYTYTITAGGKTSKEYSYKTPAFGGESFTFAAVGDPQLYANNLSANVEGWTKTVNEVLSDGTDYSFLFSLGDQINEYYAQDGSNLSKVESEYSGFFNNENLQSIALATLVGNHDNGNNSTLYTEHFQMPGVTSYGQNREGDGDYSFTYGGVQFMVLNTSNLSIADHKAFLEDTLKKNPNANWNVVSFHKSIYSVASHVTEGDIVQLRTGLSPIFKQLGIDVVLQGHDHVYARSYIMGGEDGMTADVQKNEDGTALTDIYQPNGVQYVTLNSGSGSKFYQITNEAFTYTAVQNQEKVPNYSKVSVTPDTFTVTTYRTSDQSVVDTFTLHKNAKDPEQPEQPEQPEKPEKQPCDGGANCPTKGFTDVDQTRYYHEAVDQLYQDGIMKGMSDTVYGVDQPMTRGMVVTVLYRMAGSPDVTGTSTFTDLRKGAYYEKAVIWAAENDIAQGYNKATFAPDQTVSRQQMAAFLYRYAKIQGMDVSGQSDLSGFKDNGSVGQYAKTAMAWAVNAGIIQGTATDTLAPTDVLLRQQCAVMLYRLENIK